MAYQAGIVSGGVVLALIMIVKQVTVLFGKFVINDVTIALNADGMALLVGIIAMVVVAARQREDVRELHLSSRILLLLQQIPRVHVRLSPEKVWEHAGNFVDRLP